MPSQILGIPRVLVTSRTLPPRSLLYSSRVISTSAASRWLVMLCSTVRLNSSLAMRFSNTPSEPFSAREVAILRLLAGGYSNKEIARSLFLAEGTVKNYVSTILDKLGTRDRTRAVLKAITLRVI